MKAPIAYEMVQLRDKKIAVALGITKWKVTARYSLQLTRKKAIECVRVRGFTRSGVGLVRHLSVGEFRRLFVSVDERVVNRG